MAAFFQFIFELFLDVAFRLICDYTCNSQSGPVLPLTFYIRPNDLPLSDFGFWKYDDVTLDLDDSKMC